MRQHPIPPADSIKKMSEKHLGKLKLGMLFPSYHASWHGEETLEFVTLIDRLCNTLDKHGPALLDEICAQRMEEIGLEPLRGSVILASQNRQKKDGSYKDILAPNCYILRMALAEGKRAYWNQKGCGALFNLITEMIRLVTVTLPNMLDNARSADPSTFREFRHQV
jgi:hypothetical protein